MFHPMNEINQGNNEFNHRGLTTAGLEQTEYTDGS